MQLYFRIIATLNLFFVICVEFGLQPMIYGAIFTTIILFADGITSHTKSPFYFMFLLGALLNFNGVVIGGLIGTPGLIYLANIGAGFLLASHFLDNPKRSI